MARKSVSTGGDSDAAQTPYQPNAMECALLFLMLIDAKSEEDNGKRPRRLRLAEITVRRMTSRRYVSPEFLREVQDWLDRAGWTLFFAGDSYALLRSSAVKGWPRLTSAPLKKELGAVRSGRFAFAEHYYLLREDADEADDD